MNMINAYTVDETEDEFGTPRFFVANPSCDWVDGPYDSIDQANDRAEWRNRKVEGTRVRFLLDALPVGAEIHLSGHGKRWVPNAYAALYRKNEEGLWDQVANAQKPYVINMDPEHLGFCVGEKAIRSALAERKA